MLPSKPMIYVALLGEETISLFYVAQQVSKGSKYKNSALWGKKMEEKERCSVGKWFQSN